MAIALVEQILITDDNKTEESLLRELHEILLNTKPVPCNDISKSSEIMSKHCKHLYATLPPEMVTEVDTFLSAECFELHTHQQTSISVFLDFDSNAICQFLGWVFEREYGWTERCQTDSNYSNILSIDSGNKTKTLCEHFIIWFENHDHLSYYLLLGYRASIKSSSSSPVVRKQILLSMFRWLRNLSHKCVILPAKCFAVLQDIALLGLTDVWSAIRKDTTSRLGLVLDLLMLDQMEQLFLSLIDICNCGKCKWQEEKTWQSTEGAIRGIYKFLTSCKWVATSSVVKKDDLTLTPSVLIKIGKINFPSLPPFMQDNLESIVFKLFAHPQLTVRELAGKAFSAFLNKSEYSYFIESFEKVVQHLGKYVVNMDEGYTKCMNAYEAEGFMNAVLFLIKNVPLVHLLCKWGEYWSIFSHYLIHPASTVRQAASLVFKYLVSKDLTSLSLLKLVLHSLCMDWITDYKSLKNPRKTEDVKRRRCSTMELKKSESDGFVATWEWREGRLFAYELIMKFLLTNHVYFSLSKATEQVQRNNGNINVSTSVNVQRTRVSVQGRKSFESLEKLEKLTGQKRSLTRSLTLSTVSSTELSQPAKGGTKYVEESIQGESLITMAQHENVEKGHFLLSSIPSLKLTSLPDICIADIINDQAKQCAAEQTMMRWLSNQTLSPFKVLLKQILIHSIECLHEVRWELRRMSQQLLPIVCDVIRHLDNEILGDFYCESINCLDSVMYNGCCVCLLYSIKSYIKLKYPCGRSTPNKVFERRKVDPEDAEKQITKNFSYIISTLAEHISKLCRPETSDTCIEILILYQIHFNNEMNNLDKVICGYIQKLYSNSEGNILCEGDQKYSKDHLDFLCEIQTSLLEYCECTSEKYTVHILPTLLQSICLCKSNSLDIHTILICAELILQRLQNNKSGDIGELQYVLTTICNEACCLLQKNDLQLQYTRQVFSICFSLQSIMVDDFPLDAIIQIVNSKLENVNNETSYSKYRDMEEISEDMNVNKEVRSGDRRLSVSLTFSTSSRESSRLSDISDSDEEGNEEHTENESSDWDWSSGEENEKASENSSAMQLVFAGFINDLRSTTV